jgi:hypothetical protein
MRTSVVAGHYEKAIDRESAYEILTKKASEATPAPNPEAEARRAEFERRRRQEQETAAETKSSKKGGRQTDSVFIVFCKSAVRSIANGLGRAITRGIFGSMTGKKK